MTRPVPDARSGGGCVGHAGIVASCFVDGLLRYRPEGDAHDRARHVDAAHEPDVRVLALEKTR